MLAVAVGALELCVVPLNPIYQYPRELLGIVWKIIDQMAR